MIIELRAIEVNERLSEDSLCFSADLFIDGGLAGHASNRGDGGHTAYSGISEKENELIKKAEQYCRSLPDDVLKAGDKTFSYEMSLAYYIDDLVYQYLELKTQKNVTTMMKQHILVGTHPLISYDAYITIQPIGLLLKMSAGKQYLLNELLKIKGLLRGNEQILNSNIPVSILKEAGFRPGQYSVFEGETNAEKAIKKRKGI